MRSSSNTKQPPYSDEETQFQGLLSLLSSRGVVQRWAKSATPIADLHNDCKAAVANHDQRAAFTSYLSANSIAIQSAQTFLFYLVAVASIRPQELAGPAGLVAPYGARIASWLPTYLVINGPLGQFLRAPESPLNILLRTNSSAYPALTEARNMFNSELFRLVRNGFGHWSFSLENRIPAELSVVCYDEKSGKETILISRAEAEALHFVSFTIIKAIDQYIFSVTAPPQNGT